MPGELWIDAAPISLQDLSAVSLVTLGDETVVWADAVGTLRERGVGNVPDYVAAASGPAGTLTTWDDSLTWNDSLIWTE